MTEDEIQSCVEGCIISNSVVVQNLDHLGIVAGIVDELGLVDVINEGSVAMMFSFLESMRRQGKNAVDHLFELIASSGCSPPALSPG